MNTQKIFPNNNLAFVGNKMLKKSLFEVDIEIFRLKKRQPNQELLTIKIP